MGMADQLQEPPRLKTCETCFRAKIRCNRTQDSGHCDRCLRLGKVCVFAAARHRKPPRSRADRADRADLLEVVWGERTPSTRSRTQSPTHPRSNPSLAGSPLGAASSGTLDPVAGGALTGEHATTLLHIYNSRMSPHFPFVRLPATTSIETLRQQRPCLCLAVLAAASYGDMHLQKSLYRSFNTAVADRLVHSNLASLDLLQGLLVHTAWAHYQPQPRRHSQHLHLAASIVSDMRLDRPKNLTLWNVEKYDPVHEQEQRKEPQASAEELRALIGTYYLASNSSIVLQKLRHFPYSDFILESGTRLAALGEYPTDAYLPYIVRLQKLSDAADDILRYTPSVTSVEAINGLLTEIRTKLESFKSALPFPFSDCSALSLQVSFLELLLGQMPLPWFPFTHKRLQRTMADDAQKNGLSAQNAQNAQLADCLVQVVTAARSLVGFLLNMTPGEEFFITNMAWVMLSCGLSLAARVDVLVRDPSVAPFTQHLVQFLDMQQALRQTTLRLESAAAAASATTHATHEADGGPNTFRQFLARTRAIDSWYQRQVLATTNSSLGSSLSESSASSGLPVDTPQVHISSTTPHDGTAHAFAHTPGINATFRAHVTGANPVLYEAGCIEGTAPSHMTNFQDMSLFDFLSDRPIPDFDFDMSGL